MLPLGQSAGFESHGAVLYSQFSPHCGQLTPPYFGSGLLQVLYLYLIQSFRVAQVLVQLDQPPHSPYPAPESNHNQIRDSYLEVTLKLTVKAINVCCCSCGNYIILA